jgi:hypothetical protein
MSAAGGGKPPLSVVQVGGDLNTSGDLEAFGLDGSGSLYHIYQHIVDAQGEAVRVWSNFFPLSGFDVAEFAVGRNQDDSLAVVGVDSPHGTVRYCSQATPGDSTSWSGWTPIGSGHTIVHLALVLDPDGYLELFGATKQGSVEHASQLSPGSIAWSGWTPLGVASGRIATLTAGQNWDGRLEVFGADRSGLVVHTAQLPGATGPSGAWSGGWTTLGSGYQMKKLAVARNADGRLELFGMDGNGRLAHMTQDSKGSASWSNWRPLPSISLASEYKVTDFAVAMDASERLNVCAAFSNYKNTENSNSIRMAQNSPGSDEYTVGILGVDYKIDQIAINGHLYGAGPEPPLVVYGIDNEHQYALWILVGPAIPSLVWMILGEVAVPV